MTTKNDGGSVTGTKESKLTQIRRKRKLHKNTTENAKKMILYIYESCNKGWVSKKEVFKTAHENNNISRKWSAKFFLRYGALKEITSDEGNLIQWNTVEPDDKFCLKMRTVQHDETVKYDNQRKKEIEKKKELKLKIELEELANEAKLPPEILKTPVVPVETPKIEIKTELPVKPETIDSEVYKIEVLKELRENNKLLMEISKTLNEIYIKI